MHGPPSAKTRQPAIGPLRRVLRLIVELDESPTRLHRIRAALLLIGLLTAFGLLGYWLPTLLERALR